MQVLFEILRQDIWSGAQNPVPLSNTAFRTQVPWFAAAVWAVTGAATGMGLWLLFSRHDTSLRMLAANLPLVVSTLWAFAHHVTAGMALWFALGLRRDALGIVSSTSEVQFVPVDCSEGARICSL